MTAPALDHLRQLAGHRQTGENQYQACCPAHEDREASLSISLKPDGKILLHCFAGCTIEDICKSIGIQERDLFPEERGGGDLIPFKQRCNTATPPEGCTLEQYSKAKNIPIDVLKNYGLAEISYQKVPAVKIPYLDPEGLEAAVQFRLALRKGEGTDNRFKWRSGSKTLLYGLWKLQAAHEAGYIVRVEGASDCHTLWYNNIPAVGLPGAANWKDNRDAGHLKNIPIIYIVIEPDAGGAAVLKGLENSEIRHRAHLVSLAPFKDPSDLYVNNPQLFLEKWNAAIKAAIPWKIAADKDRTQRNAEAWRKCSELALCPSILKNVVSAVSQMGVVGEERLTQIIYLAVNTRFQKRPASLAIKGPSSAGKSFNVENVLKLFPESAYYLLTAMSDRALAYDDERLQNRFLVLFEAAGMRGDMASYLVRSLLSEGCIRYKTVEKTKDGLRPRLIEKEGPTGLITTTTLVSLHPENETRLLSIPVTDTGEQTRHVFRAIADEHEGTMDFSRWHAFQEWLSTGELSVTIPYSKELADLVPPVAVRLRRDFGMLLTLIRGHALLHRASRKLDATGRIVATIEDYDAVRELVADLVAEGVEATVSAEIRQTVATVSSFMSVDTAGVALSQIAKSLKLDKSVISRRVTNAIHRGYLKNLEDKKGRPARIVTADPLPDEQELLPSRQTLADRCTVAPLTEGIHIPPPPPCKPKWRPPRVDGEGIPKFSEGKGTPAKADGDSNMMNSTQKELFEPRYPKDLITHWPQRRRQQPEDLKKQVQALIDFYRNRRPTASRGPSPNFGEIAPSPATRFAKRNVDKINYALPHCTIKT
jgi:hypothetical protein